MVDVKYTHETLNHTENFVDPTTGAHTQTIESLWHVYKMHNKRQRGTQRSLVESFLCEFVWREHKVGENPGESTYLTSPNWKGETGGGLSKRSQQPTRKRRPNVEMLDYVPSALEKRKHTI
ncbi:hypothetical protein CLF_102765 [Clonorchis sinensis]|uniref:ISXO2-like transposase domain-containing protein n=1 Tax=Clonorchis sinensis TaxID=79923 RepID=G7Y8G9_CLOSI|nr:hypothetical protein CLF_102765 [Clonorchis sinensis]